MSLVIPIKGGLKSERAGGFARLKYIFQISLLNYYIRYVTKIRYKYNLTYFKLKNTTVLKANFKMLINMAYY